jgi:hypothetical protein
MPTSYKVGAGKADITLAAAGRVMAGYAFEGQKTSGDVDLRLFARAFYIQENRSAPRHLCLVVIDAWACPEPIKTLVLNKLAAAGVNALNRANLVISATHTHAGPGGYANHFLYTFTTGGFDEPLVDAMVDGIVAAIRQAKNNLADGHIYFAKGDLVGCGDNRSISGYRANPEAAAADGFDRRTDREMTVLKFVQNVGTAHREIGLYSIFAIHPTSLGIYNVEISGDNKGWAARFCEDAEGAGYVAAFANGSAGDVSPNVTVTNTGGTWTTQVRKPEGGPRDVVKLQADKDKMKNLARLQSDKARDLAQGAVAELTGRLDFRCTHVDFSNVRISGVAGAKTWPAALGASFTAGSREENRALLKLFFNFNFEPKIEEGTNKTAFAQGEAKTRTIISSAETNAIRDAKNSFLLGLALLDIATKIDDIRDDPAARSWVFPTCARTFFIDLAQRDDPQKTGTIAWDWDVPHLPNWRADYVNGQGQKPITLPVGITKLKRWRGLAELEPVAAPMVPHVIPLQLVKIGDCCLAALPNEFSTVAGYRLKAKIKAVLGAAVQHVALAGYSNDYAFYVTTPEEYDVQNYEAASTLYGPHTLAAMLQETSKLATVLKNGTAVSVGRPVPPPAIFYKR